MYPYVKTKLGCVLLSLEIGNIKTSTVDSIFMELVHTQNWFIESISKRSWNLFVTTQGSSSPCIFQYDPWNAHALEKLYCEMSNMNILLKRIILIPTIDNYFLTVILFISDHFWWSCDRIPYIQYAILIHLVGLTSHYVTQRGKSPKIQCTHVRC